MWQSFLTATLWARRNTTTTWTSPPWWCNHVKMCSVELLGVVINTCPEHIKLPTVRQSIWVTGSSVRNKNERYPCHYNQHLHTKHPFIDAFPLFMRSLIYVQCRKRWHIAFILMEGEGVFFLLKPALGCWYQGVGGGGGHLITMNYEPG